MERVIDVSIQKKLSAHSLIEVDFKAPPGLTVLFGRSGAGKSVTLQCIAGLIRPDSGRISVGKNSFFDSEKKINMRPPERNVGYVFQSFALFPHLDVFGNVAIGLNGGKREVKQKVGAILEEVGISNLIGRYPSELSGGEQQRVAVVRALMLSPDLVLADEPTGNLDTHTSDELFALIKALNRDTGVTVIMVTHNEKLAAQADRIIKMVDGQIEQ